MTCSPIFSVARLDAWHRSMSAMDSASMNPFFSPIRSCFTTRTSTTRSRLPSRLARRAFHDATRAVSASLESAK
jgi:hypothetical protein